jgi:hypothetical protein
VARNAAVTVNPAALAAFRPRNSSNFMGCCYRSRPKNGIWSLHHAGMIRRINGSLGFCIMAEFTSAPTYSTAILGQVSENLIAPPQSCLRS